MEGVVRLQSVEAKLSILMVFKNSVRVFVSAKFIVLEPVLALGREAEPVLEL